MPGGYVVTGTETSAGAKNRESAHDAIDRESFRKMMLNSIERCLG
uniref:Uncharacterized protein n=1 Tax=Anopheles minimus TaxID=112268 RepID=A0A182WN33_9DIPT